MGLSYPGNEASLIPHRKWQELAEMEERAEVGGWEQGGLIHRPSRIPLPVAQILKVIHAQVGFGSGAKTKARNEIIK